MNREQRRAAAKNKDTSEVEEQVALFNKLPDECLTCNKAYDRNDKEMAMTWSVVIHDAEELVRLYCPECWEKAKKITEEFAKHLEEKYGSMEE
mgnify:CR=1 FL=1|jgi:hypothetical protein|tara:strand:+ start:22 stop:300 length:279 start_codon:yes stop_codon:yes gene_type:complete